MANDTITPIKRTTVSESVMEQLARLIANGTYAAGQQLPTERELAALFGVARGPVREALRALALIGLVDIKPGLGVFVRPSGTLLLPGQSVRDVLAREVADVREVYQARRIIEGAQIVMASQVIAPEQIEELHRLLGEMERVSEENPLDVEEFARWHYRFDLVVAQAAANKVLLDIFIGLRDLELAAHRKALLLPTAMENSNRQHRDILEALERRDVVLAQQAATAHFDSADRVIEAWMADGVYNVGERP